jgi:hypothetical protein
VRRKGNEKKRIKENEKVKGAKKRNKKRREEGNKKMERVK